MKKNDLVKLILLFLFSVGFLNKSFYILIVLAIFSFYIGEKFLISKQFKVISLFSLSFYCIYIYHYGFSLNTFGQYLIGPILSVYIGHNLINGYNLKRKHLYIVFLCISLGLYIHGSLNMISQYRINRFS